MPKFRNKPVIVEALRYDDRASRFGWPQEIADAHPWLDAAYEAEVLSNVRTKSENGDVWDHHLEIKTLKGMMRADPGDWIILGIKGEIYPCKTDVFEATYEAVEAEA